MGTPWNFGRSPVHLLAPFLNSCFALVLAFCARVSLPNNGSAKPNPFYGYWCGLLRPPVPVFPLFLLLLGLLCFALFLFFSGVLSVVGLAWGSWRARRHACLARHVRRALNLAVYHHGWMWFIVLASTQAWLWATIAIIFQWLPEPKAEKCDRNTTV